VLGSDHHGCVKNVEFSHTRFCAEELIERAVGIEDRLERRMRTFLTGRLQINGVYGILMAQRVVEEEQLVQPVAPSACFVGFS